MAREKTRRIFRVSPRLNSFASQSPFSHSPSLRTFHLTTRERVFNLDKNAGCFAAYFGLGPVYMEVGDPR